VAVTRVLLAGLPPLLSGIVRNVAETDRELTIVAELRELAGVRIAAESKGASVVVVDGLPANESAALAEELQAIGGNIRLVVIDADGSAATSMTTHGYRRVVAPSPETLLELMRG
jgi:DNA-binding NarL/FixJ family response regulator